ncbi:MAG: HAD family hydrolase [Desulfuromonadales bacterium]|nr:HAD family hydrolase [Desulfuromonadales bacterium]
MIPFERQNIKTVLFDLDGTLLQIEMQNYISTYAASLAASLHQRAATDKVVDAVFSAIRSLIKRDSGDISNEAYFFRHIADLLQLDVELIGRNFAGFFSTGLPVLDPFIQPLDLARSLLEACLERGLDIVIATNPVFPKVVVESRLARAKLADFPFHRVTSYENCRRCKPNPVYFSDILTELNLPAESCLMIGNDTKHDLAARKVGIPTFLVDTWLIDRCQGDFTTDLRGGHTDLLDFIMTIDKQR